MIIHKSFEYKFEFNDRELTANIVIEHDACDSDPLDQDFESEADRQDFIRKLANGTYQNTYVKVTAYYAHVEGSDSLGGCVLSPEYSIDTVVSEYDMILNAVNELRVNIRLQYNELKCLFKPK